MQSNGPLPQVHLMVSFLTGLELMTIDNFDGDNYDDGSDFDGS